MKHCPANAPPGAANARRSRPPPPPASAGKEKRSAKWLIAVTRREKKGQVVRNRSKFVQGIRWQRIPFWIFWEFSEPRTRVSQWYRWAKIKLVTEITWLLKKIVTEGTSIDHVRFLGEERGLTKNHERYSKISRDFFLSELEKKTIFFKKKIKMLPCYLVTRNTSDFCWEEAILNITTCHQGGVQKSSKNLSRD